MADESNYFKDVLGWLIDIEGWELIEKQIHSHYYDLKCKTLGQSLTYKTTKYML